MMVCSGGETEPLKLLLVVWLDPGPGAQDREATVREQARVRAKTELPGGSMESSYR